jgi:hypothetical protein
VRLALALLPDVGNEAVECSFSLATQVVEFPIALIVGIAKVMGDDDMVDRLIQRASGDVVEPQVSR